MSDKTPIEPLTAEAWAIVNAAMEERALWLDGKGVPQHIVHEKRKALRLACDAYAEST